MDVDYIMNCYTYIYFYIIYIYTVSEEMLQFERKVEGVVDYTVLLPAVSVGNVG